MVRAGASAVVLDWKAGDDRREARAEAGRQLTAYAAVEVEECSCHLERVRVQAAFLASAPEWEPERVDEADVEALRARLAGDLEGERELRRARGGLPPGGDDWREAAAPRAVAGVCARYPFMELCPEGRLASSKARLPRRAYTP